MEGFWEYKQDNWYYFNENKIFFQQDEDDRVNTKFSGTSATIAICMNSVIYIGHIGDARAIIGKK